MAKGRYVRRHDKNGNPYFVDRDTGKRVARERWERERARIRKQETQQPVKQKPPPKPPTPPERPPGVPPPFPPGVGEPGWPEDDFGQFDDDAFSIEGEDDT